MKTEENPIPSVWAKPSRKREQPALSRDLIVAEAIKLMDADGIDALSMRHLGTRLNAGATSLYRHVANRDELIELVVDEVYGEITAPEVTDPAAWREAVAVCAGSVRDMILRHPWMASVLGGVGLSYLGPNVMRLNERMLDMLHKAGFDPEEANFAISAVISYVIGIGISEGAYLSMIARSGKTEQEWADELRPAVAQAIEDHPLLRDELNRYEGRSPQEDRDLNFDYGLQRMLDGLAVRLG